MDRSTSKDKAINFAKTRLRNHQANLAAYRLYREELPKAVDQYLDKKYAPLKKALAEYGSIGEIHNAYGYGYIGEKKYQSIMYLYEQYENDATNRLLVVTLEQIDRTIEELSACVDTARRDLNTLITNGGDE